MPDVSAITAATDPVLACHGFSRRRNTWSRESGELRHVINLQIDKSFTQVTLNAGTFDDKCHELVWGRRGSISINNCVLIQRVGFLIGDTDRWWPLDAVDTPKEVATCAEIYAVPFLDTVKDRRAEAVALASSRELGWPYPLPKLMLAALLALLDDRSQAAGLLQQVRSTSGGWAKVAIELERRIA
jgi:hypothetical protein